MMHPFTEVCFVLPITQQDIIITLDPYLIVCSLGGIIVIDDKYNKYYYGMIEGLMIF